MSATWKICLGVLLVLVIVGQACLFFPVETSALVWHIKHGSHIELGDVRIKVPLLYKADISQGLRSLSISRDAGRTSNGFSEITIDFDGRFPPPSIQSSMLAYRLEKVSETSIIVAGRRGTCIEYQHELDGSGDVPMALLMLITPEIQCSCDGNLRVRFLGTPDHEEEFYRIIRGAEHISRLT